MAHGSSARSPRPAARSATRSSRPPGRADGPRARPDADGGPPPCSAPQASSPPPTRSRRPSRSPRPRSVQTPPGVDPRTEWIARAQITLTSLDSAARHARADRAGVDQAAAGAAHDHPARGGGPAGAQSSARAAEGRAPVPDRHLPLARPRPRRTPEHRAPPAGRRGRRSRTFRTSRGAAPEQASELAALDEQRDLRLRQREAKRDELEDLERGVDNAVRTPLPDDEEETTEVSERVLDVVEGGGSDDESDG